MAKKGNNAEKREETLLELITLHQPISAPQLHSLIGKDKELRKRCSLLDEKNYGKNVLTPTGKKMVNLSINALKKKNYIKEHHDDDSLISYTVIPQEEREQRLALKAEEKTKERYITWSDPIYVKENNRWEFYQKDQDGAILEIYHNEDEEKLREEHKQKVMSHIMAAMKGQNQETNKEETLKEKVKLVGLGNIKSKDGKQKKDSSVFLHQEAKFTIMRMRLEGYPYVEIIDKVSQEFNLSVMSVSLYFTDVLKDIRERAKDSVDQTIHDHLERYEELFKWFKQNGYTRAALKALERKEKLLGLHGQDDVVEGVLKGLMGEKEGEGKYAWEQLSKSERKRLMELVLKTVVLIKDNDKK